MNAINIGSELIDKNPIQAQRLISRGLLQYPEQAVGWFNLGIALHQQKKIAGAIRAYRQSISVSRDLFYEARNNLAQDLLLNGEWSEGWQLYEYRLSSMKDNLETYYNFFGAPWKGVSDTRTCKHLILVAEQGYGDTIQFCRLLQTIKNMGIRTSLFCQDALAPLLRQCDFIDEVRVSLSVMDENVLWAPLLSLPYLLDLQPDSIPMSSGYLKVDNEYLSKWKSILCDDKDKFTIGIHWQGNRSFEKRLYSKNRSIPYCYFESLTNIK